MAHNRQYPIVVGLGAAAGGMLIAALGHVATAPSARADTTDVTNIIDALEFSAGAGQQALTDASTDLFSGDVAGALGNSLVAWDDYALAPQYDVLANGYADLAGITGLEDNFFFGPLLTPTDLSGTIADITSYIDVAQQSLTTASGEFAADNITGALTSLSVASEELTEGVQVGLLGLTDTWLGLMVPE